LCVFQQLTLLFELLQEDASRHTCQSAGCGTTRTSVAGVAKWAGKGWGLKAVVDVEGARALGESSDTIGERASIASKYKMLGGSHM
jgi:hypothetical protein